MIKNIEFSAGYITITDEHGGKTKHSISGFLTPGVISSVMIADNAITTAKIALDTILAVDIGAGSVDTSELAALGVTKEKMAWANGKYLLGAGLSVTPTEVTPYADSDALAAAEAGAVSAATASKLLIRDGAGRAKMVAPSAEDDIALKSNVTTVASALTSHEAVKAANAVLGHVIVETGSAIDVDGDGKLTLTIPNDAIGSEHIEDLDADLTLAAAVKIIFRASTEYINSSGVGLLDLGAATAIVLGADLRTDHWGGKFNNTFIGVSVVGAGNLNTSTGDWGQYNTALGYQALYGLVKGQRNIAIGYQAGYTMNEGSSNICIGEGAGNGVLANSGRCIVIGKNVDVPSETDGQMLIGENANGQGQIRGYDQGIMEIKALSNKEVRFSIGGTVVAAVEVKGLLLPSDVDSALVAEEVTLGGFDEGGTRMLAISCEQAIVTEAAGASDRSLEVRINGATLKLLLHT